MTAEAMAHHAFGAKPGAHRDWLVEFILERDMENVAEVGVLSGATTKRILAGTRAHVWAVDNWEGVPDDPVQAAIYRNPVKSERVFRRNMRPYLRTRRVEIIKADAVEAAAEVARRWGPVLDLVFLDADHRYEQTLAAILAWRGLLRPGGVLAGHDLNWPGVRKAVEEACFKYAEAPGNCWWLEVDG